ncbi:ParB/RepB/Spo0J family partition protein [Streptomyces sp. NPDC004129]
MPIEVRPELSHNGLDFEVMTVENLQRRDLNPIEEAELYRKLASAGRSQRQIAKRVGRVESHVSKRLALLELPQQVQERVAAGTLKIGEALAMAADVVAQPGVSRGAPAAAGAGTTPSGPACATPEVPDERVRERPDLRDRQLCCARLAARVPTANSALRRLSAAVLQLSPSSEALGLAHGWLRRAGVGPEIDDPAEYAQVAADAGPRLRIQIAHAVALAADEPSTARARAWGRREVAHVRPLIDEVGYLPSSPERRLLARQGVTPAESDDSCEATVAGDFTGIGRGAT